MPKSNSTKLCTVCGEPVNGDCYTSAPSRHKECHKRKARENRAALLDYYQAYDRDRFQNNQKRRAAQLESMRKNRDPDKAVKANREYRQRNREKYAAHVAIRHALSTGTLQRKATCDLCGGPSEHAHHDDYSKPLEVRWLCGPCHRKVHRKINEAKREQRAGKVA